MNPIKSNIGLIVLSISIVFSALILSINKVTHESYYGPNNETKLSLTGEIGAHRIPIGIKTNSNDVTYFSELNVGLNQQLVIEQSNGKIQTINGDNITAKYFHVTHLLSVTFEVAGKPMFKNFYSPINWSNEE